MIINRKWQDTDRSFLRRRKQMRFVYKRLSVVPSKQSLYSMSMFKFSVDFIPAMGSRFIPNSIYTPEKIHFHFFPSHSFGGGMRGGEGGYGGFKLMKIYCKKENNNKNRSVIQSRKIYYR